MGEGREREREREALTIFHRIPVFVSTKVHFNGIHKQYFAVT